MKIYTVQPQIVVDELLKNRIVYPISIHESIHESHECDSFKKAYSWLYEQMKLMNKDLGKNNGGMFWAHNRKADSYYYNGMLLELEKPTSEVIVSDYNMWHCILNNSPVVTQEEDYDYWESLSPDSAKNYLYDSWKKILDIRITPKHRIKPGVEIQKWYDKGERQVYQTCFTSIKLEDIRNISVAKKFKNIVVD